MEKKITLPLTREKTENLHCGDNVLISGVIYTGRDAAHKRLVELLEAGKELPIDVKDSIIYYVGPAPAKPGQVIGSARAHYQLPHGRLRSRTFGPGTERYDWKRETVS